MLAIAIFQLATFRMGLGRLLRSFSRPGYVRDMTTLFTSEEKPLEEIRRHLLQFPGGSVDLVKGSDGIAVVVLNQAQKKNAMTGKMMVDLHDVVDDLATWQEGKGVIVKGSNGNFCSGGDLDFVRRINTPEDGFIMSTFMQNVLNKFQSLPMISVALIEGVGALGGGAELSVACDFRLMADNCKGIGFVHGKMGILPAWGGTNRLVEKVGYTRALDLLSTGRISGPSECLKLGLVDELVPADADADEFTASWMKTRTQFDVAVVRGIKVSVRGAQDQPGDYETERRIFAPFWGSPGNREALQRNIKHRPEVRT